MMHYFLFGGACSRDFGMYISGDSTYDAPERDTESIEIPGRNGALEIDNGRFHNISVSYPAFFPRGFSAGAAAARNWLAGARGYQRLEDTYHPDEYRLARFVGPLQFDVRALGYSGECTLTFDAKPQRFLRSGEAETVLSATGSVYNPTGFDARPLLRVYGTAPGVLTVGNAQVQVNAISGYIDIDCDLQDAFKGTANCNASIYAPVFPRFTPGINNISWSGGLTGVTIKPRWWTI